MESANAKWRKPTRSDRLPLHRSESPTGYSSTGCSPAEPASASPVADNPSPSGESIKCALYNLTAKITPSRPTRLRRRPCCHFYFAQPVTFLSCADKDCSEASVFTSPYNPRPDPIEDAKV